MRIFLDTNIFLDMLLRREQSVNVKQIIQFIQDGFYQGYVADITLLNIDYVAKKQKQDIRKFFYFFEENFQIVGADNSDILKALDIKNSDLEDNFQYILAKKSACSLIISNDKTFLKKDMPVLGSESFLIKYGIDVT